MNGRAAGFAKQSYSSAARYSALVRGTPGFFLVLEFAGSEFAGGEFSGAGFFATEFALMKAGFAVRRLLRAGVGVFLRRAGGAALPTGFAGLVGGGQDAHTAFLAFAHQGGEFLRHLGIDLEQG